MTILETSLAGLQVGNPVTHANLTMFPLLGGAAGEPAYLTLAEALAAREARVTEVSDSGNRRSDQGAVWEEISLKASRMQAESDTAAAAAMYETHAKRLDDFVQAMPPAAQQCGAAFAINGRLVGLDLFDARATFAKQAKTLVTSYALDAIDESATHAPAAQDADCKALLRDVLRADCRAFKAIGLGEDLRLGGEGIKGAALAVDGRLVHLCAFREEAGEAQAGER